MASTPSQPSPKNPSSAPLPAAAPTVSAGQQSSALPALSKYQLEIFPIEIIKVFPAAGGADSAYTGEGRDGMKYNIKTVSKTPNVPCAEWFSHKLAERIGIASAFPAVVMVNNERAYGSRWESGMLDQARNNEVLTGKLPGAALAGRFSALYTYDVFLHNTDRHAGNYAFIQVDGLYRLVAMDFSRAWSWNGWPLPPLPLAAGCSTVATGRMIRQHFAFDHGEATKVMDSLVGVSRAHIDGIFDSMPVEWADAPMKAAMLAWWGSADMTQRIDVIRKGLANGTYL